MNYGNYQFSRKRLCKILSFSKIFLKSTEIGGKVKLSNKSRLGHRKDSFGSASGIGGAASGGGRANLAVFKLGLLLKLGFSPKP